MIGELMCHITGWLAPIPYDLIIILLGLIWFTAGWGLSRRRQDRKWIRALQQLDETDQQKVIHHAHSHGKRTTATGSTDSSKSHRHRLFGRG